MHIDVRDTLLGPLGVTRSFRLSDEEPELENLTLTTPLAGEVQLTRLESSIVARGDVQTAVQLECHRCLRAFSHPLAVSFQQTYAEKPVEDELPITDQQIDLASAIREELLLALPIKQLCDEACAGLNTELTSETSADHRLRSRARVKKG